MVQNKKLSELSILTKNFRLTGKLVKVQKAEQEYICHMSGEVLCHTLRIYIYLNESPPEFKRIILF